MQPVKRDPAPSRWAWRVERLMLTPGIRLALRVGLPFFCALSLGSWYLSKPEVQQAIVSEFAALRDSVQQRPEFMVNLMAVDGATPQIDAAIRTTLPIDFPVSSFDLDLEAMRASLAEIGPIKSVSLRIRPGGVLQVDVVPRVPVAMWRSNEALVLLDETGGVISPVADRATRPDLPVIAGEGADRAVPEALALFRSASPLGSRLLGLVRVGERRWDVVLDRSQRILLPDTGAVQALERALALDAVQDLLSRDVARVDLRLKSRPTVQMQARATEERWRIREMNLQPRVLNE